MHVTNIAATYLVFGNKSRRVSLDVINQFGIPHEAITDVALDKENWARRGTVIVAATSNVV